MHRQIEAHSRNGFKTSRVVINGASLIGPADRRTVLTVQARVHYTTPGGHEASYHVNFMPDAATLLVVFKVAGKDTTARPALNQHHVVMIEQPRWGGNAVGMLEVPGGLLHEKTGFNLSSWENPTMGALREFVEETHASGGKDDFPHLDRRKIRKLGAPVTCHPALTDAQHQYFTELTITPQAFRNLRRALKDRHGGNAQEQETTKVRLMPLQQAWRTALARGESPSTVVALSRYMKRVGFLAPR